MTLRSKNERMGVENPDTLELPTQLLKKMLTFVRGRMSVNKALAE